MSKSMIAIDIGDTEVRMAQLSGSSVRLMVQRMPENLVSQNRIISPSTLAKFLKKMKSDGKFSGTNCTLLLPDSACYFRSITTAAATDAQIRFNLPYEFHDYIGGDNSNFTYDYSVESTTAGENGAADNMDLLIGAADQTVMDEYADMLRRGGLRLKTAIPRPMALIYLTRGIVTSDRAPRDEYCIIDLDYENTTAYMISAGRLKASRTIELGCRDIDAAIAETYNIDAYLASTWRESNFQNILTEECCRALYEKIALEIMKAINFYRYENQGSAINDAYFCGGGSVIEGLRTEILDYIRFEERDISELLPESCASSIEAGRCVMAIGAVLEKEA